MSVEVGEARHRTSRCRGCRGPSAGTTRCPSTAGRKVVLAFYPGDFTPGCTKQMCQYRDNFEEFQGVGGGPAGHLAPGRRLAREVDREEGLPVPAARRHREEGHRRIRRARLRPHRGEALDVRDRRRGDRAPQAGRRRSGSPGTSPARSRRSWRVCELVAGGRRDRAPVPAGEPPRSARDDARGRTTTAVTDRGERRCRRLDRDQQPGDRGEGEEPAPRSLRAASAWSTTASTASGCSSKARRRSCRCPTRWSPSSTTTDRCRGSIPTGTTTAPR